MGATPRWKVYDAHDDYQAACKDVAAAATLMALYGDGATIRAGHRIVVWAEGAEDQPAAESYDHVANQIATRLQEVT